MGADVPSGPFGPPQSSVSLGSEFSESGPECRSNQYSTCLGGGGIKCLQQKTAAGEFTTDSCKTANIGPSAPHNSPQITIKAVNVINSFH